MFNKNYGQDCAERKVPMLNLLTGRKKSVFFALEERLVATIHVNLGMSDGHLGLLGWLCKVSPQSVHRAGNGNQAPKYQQKNPLFGKGSPSPRGKTHSPISKSFREFYTHHYPASVSNLT